MVAVVAVVVVAAVWGVTFVQVKDAVALYPLFSFLAVRFAIAAAVLAAPAAGRVRSLGRDGIRAGVLLGVVLAAAYALQTAGLERTTVSSAGFITGLYVVLTPLLALVLFRVRTKPVVWAGAGLAVAGLALLSGADTGRLDGDMLVLASTGAQALQIVLVERYAARFDALALAFVEIVVALACFVAFALLLEDLRLPRGATVWGALVVTGVFASALAYLIQIWAQRRLSAARIALLFSLESPFAGLFGYLLAGDRLGVLGWTGCAVIMGGIVVAEPATADLLSRLAARPSRAPAMRRARR